MPDRESVITHLQIIHTWAEFARERDLQFFTANHLKDIAKWADDALNLLKEQSERIAIMRESMETMERRLAAVECQPIEVKSTDQMVYVGWMHEDQKLGLSEEVDDAEKNL